MRNIASLVLACVLCLASGAVAAEAKFNYIAPEALQQRLQAKDTMILVDICSVEQFKSGHIAGSLETNAYPVDTDEEKARLAALLPTIEASTADVIIVCPRGGGGAKKTVAFYISKGVDPKRLLILEKGMDGWPFDKTS
ncbi:rhodanese-like domain-containing protein [Megalodesulfovibrio gigas]|uniref:Rhodanese domain-containing protein n=1 Tax=Megalodesulfovibrio gigas (strain ATCC 19364 / DSM 1382 / NCIMB 9332 / VKM B-1759) TaxID=1121448 RepID=T2G9W4_MEGG1|nr:rhodanese-like domain-containing protein [Megalodesulfovibrio gigas]AGW13390.1 hypothetical protein DGI_1550 [Megalodesulfovibrio gigas DSM 1382 = ATCC 19364]